MATHQSAFKRMRQSKVRTARNRQSRSALRTLRKKVLAATDQNSAQQSCKELASMLDKLAQRRVIHPNKAANQKSRIARLYNRLPATAPAAVA